MDSFTYELALFLHIVGAVVWIGGLTMAFIIGSALAKPSAFWLHLVGGALSEGGLTRVTRDDAGEDEHRGDDPEQHRDRGQEAVDEESGHAGVSPAPLTGAGQQTRRRAVSGPPPMLMV